MDIYKNNAPVIVKAQVLAGGTTLSHASSVTVHITRNGTPPTEVGTFAMVEGVTGNYAYTYRTPVPGVYNGHIESSSPDGDEDVQWEVLPDPSV